MPALPRNETKSRQTGIIFLSFGNAISMKEKKILMQYYRKKMYKGRGALARGVDFIALRVIALVAFYLWFLSLTGKMNMSVALSLICVAVFSVAAAFAKSLRTESFIEKERKRLAREHMRQALALLPLERFMAAAKACAPDEDIFLYAFRQTGPLTPDDVLKAYRLAEKRGFARAAVFSAGDISEEARTFARRLPGFDMQLMPPDTLLGQAEALGLTPDAAAIDRMIVDLYHAQKQKRKAVLAAPFSKGNAKKYLILAAALTAASFLTSYPLYYRLLAGVCMSFAAISYLVNVPQPGDTAASNRG